MFSRLAEPCRVSLTPAAGPRLHSHSIADRGYPPTLREIGEHMGIRSTNGVNDHLRALERKGYLTREDMKCRALRPCDIEQPRPRFRCPRNDDESMVEVQVLGRVAAGLPLFAEENVSTRCASIACWSAAAAKCSACRSPATR